MRLDLFLIVHHGLTRSWLLSTGSTQEQLPLSVWSPTMSVSIASSPSSVSSYRPRSRSREWSWSSCELPFLSIFIWSCRTPILMGLPSQCCIRDREPPSQHRQGCSPSVLSHYYLLCTSSFKANLTSGLKISYRFWESSSLACLSLTMTPISCTTAVRLPSRPMLLPSLVLESQVKFDLFLS